LKSNVVRKREGHLSRRHTPILPYSQLA
jgi:hypothetical protein